MKNRKHTYQTHTEIVAILWWKSAYFPACYSLSFFYFSLLKFLSLQIFKFSCSALHWFNSLKTWLSTFSIFWYLFEHNAISEKFIFILLTFHKFLPPSRTNDLTNYPWPPSETRQMNDLKVTFYKIFKLILSFLGRRQLLDFYL